MDGCSLPLPNAKRLEGKVAVITGGARGIGATAVKLFVQHGAQVVIADILDDLGHALCKEVGSEETLCFVHCDVTCDSDVQNAVNTAVTNYGKLDIMFANAGVSGKLSSKILENSSEDIKKVLDVNVIGAFSCAKYAAEVMIPAKRGSILFTASICTVVAGLSPLGYGISKHALVGLTKHLCVGLGKHGIRVNCISPFAVYTPLTTDMIGIEKTEADELTLESAVLKETVLELEDVAEAAIYLASDDSKYVSGQNLVLDGGYGTTNLAYDEALKKRMPS